MPPKDQPTDTKTESIRLLAEISAGVAALHEDIQHLAAMIVPIAEMDARLAGCVEKLEAALEAGILAPPAPAAATPEQPDRVYCDFHADTILLTYDDAGNPAYKIKGQPFAKFGVRIWPETLPILGIDPATLKPGPNPISLWVRAVLNPETNKPRKVVGLAPIQNIITRD